MGEPATAMVVTEADPALSAWRDWLAASERLDRCCEAQQRLEADVLATAAQDLFEPATELAYHQALASEREAAEMEQILAERLSSTPAQTLAGIAAKLRAILRQGEWCENCPEFPWPQIRSALHDLVRLGRLDAAGGLPPA
jgi:hypothetical protein